MPATCRPVRHYIGLGLAVKILIGPLRHRISCYPRSISSRRDDGPAHRRYPPLGQYQIPSPIRSASTAGTSSGVATKMGSRVPRERMERHRHDHRHREWAPHRRHRPPASPARPPWKAHPRNLRRDPGSGCSGAAGTPSPAASGPAGASGVDGHLHFARVMTVIVHQHGLATAGFKLAILLEAAPHPSNLESARMMASSPMPSSVPHRDGSGGVEERVDAGAELRSPPAHPPPAAPGSGCDCWSARKSSTCIGIIALRPWVKGWDGRSLGSVRPRITRSSRTPRPDRRTAGVQEIDEGGLQPGEIATIGVHVIHFDVGHDGNHGLPDAEASLSSASAIR